MYRKTYKRMRLKKRKKIGKIEKIIIIILSIVLISGILLFKIGKSISNKVMNYAEIEVTKISKIIVNTAVDEVILKELDEKALYEINKNSNNEIQSIDFNTVFVNKLLNSINKNIQKKFVEFETGTSTDINLNQNLITNTSLEKRKKGIIMEIPTGIITNNAILNNLGPKIPVRISLSGELESYISTTAENYGINNAIISVSVNIKVSEQIILPVTTKKTTIENTIPIAIKIIQGNIPDYYLNGINSNSNLLTIPNY